MNMIGTWVMVAMSGVCLWLVLRLRDEYARKIEVMRRAIERRFGVDPMAEGDEIEYPCAIKAWDAVVMHAPVAIATNVLVPLLALVRPSRNSPRVVASGAGVTLGTENLANNTALHPLVIQSVSSDSDRS